MRRRAVLVLLLSPAIAACGARSRVGAPAGGTRVQHGLASWYGVGDGYHGRRTANGERFNRNRLTAAHFDLPFNARVRVRNLRNQRRVDLRINDRIPPETRRMGRILDVSYAAARRLDMVRDGVVPIQLEVLRLPRGGR